MSPAALGVSTHSATHVVERRVSAIEKEPNKEFPRKHCRIQALGLRQQIIQLKRESQFSMSHEAVLSIPWSGKNSRTFHICTPHKPI